MNWNRRDAVRPAKSLVFCWFQLRYLYALAIYTIRIQILGQWGFFSALRRTRRTFLAVALAVTHADC